MTLVVEDGSGITGAESYLSVADGDNLLGNNGAWKAANDESKESALRMASSYADVRWVNVLGASSVVNETQGLAFPRANLFGKGGVKIQGIPKNWITAVALYAGQEVGGGLWPSAVTQQADVKSLKVTVGPITKETTFVNGAERAFKSYPQADTMIRALFPFMQARTIV